MRRHKGKQQWGRITLTALGVTLAVATPAAAREYVHEAPFARAGAGGQHDCPIESTWGNCGYSAEAKESGEISASAWLVRAPHHTGGRVSAVSSGSVDVVQRLNRPAKAVKVTALVELRSLRAQWRQDGAVEQRASDWPDEVRAAATLTVESSRSGYWQPFADQQALVRSPGIEAVMPGLYRVTRTVRAYEGSLAPGDLQLTVRARTSVSSYSQASGWLASTADKDTGDFKADADVRVRSIKVEVE